MIVRTYLRVLKKVEVAGSILLISATPAKVHEEHTLRGLTGKPSQLLHDMELFWGLYSGVLHSWSRSAWAVGRLLETGDFTVPFLTTIPSLIRTILPEYYYNYFLLRGFYLVEIFSPRGGTRVPSYFAGDIVAC